MQARDLGRVVTVSDAAVAPDGSCVAVVVGRIDLDANRARSSIWLVAVGDGEARRLTSGDVADGNPRWSPDGDRLAFTRTEGEGDDARTSVLVVPVGAEAVDGGEGGEGGEGELMSVATTTESVTSLEWSPDGARLAWCARVPEVEPGTPDRDRPPRPITTLFSRLDDVGWTIDRRTQVHVAATDASGEPRAVTSGPFEHTRVQWSPDGRTLAVIAARHEGWDLDEVVDLWLVDPDGAGEPRRLTAGTRAWSSPSWSPDGTRIAALARQVATGWHNARPVVLEVATGTEVDAAPGLDRTFAPFPGERPPVWEGDGETLLVNGEDRGRVTVWRLDSAGGRPPEVVVGGDRVVQGFDAAAGVLAAVVGDPTHPAELEVGGRRTGFTDGFVAAVPPLPVQRFVVPSPAGDGDLDAWLVTPDGWDPEASDGRRWPLLLAVHGGPMTQYADRWFDEFQLLAGAGFVVLAANPHGSSGREEGFGRTIRSPKAAIDPGAGWGGIDADDLLAVVDATLERWPALDPARVGVLGGSYGGFMATWLLGHSDRFAAGCSERAVNNLLSEEWSADVGGSFHRELGITHLEDPDEYLRMSPVTAVRKITAPILLLHSENDLRCPPEQADALYVALRLLGHPDVEYWRFPGEGHEMSRSGSPWHRIRRAEIINAFFERTLGAGAR